MNSLPSGAETLRIAKAVFGGEGLAHTLSGETVHVPFVLAGELVEASDPSREPSALRILEPSPDRVEARCLHFGICGGCQYQMGSYPAQIAMKETILREILKRAGLAALPALRSWGSPEPYGYRNRIRLRVRLMEGEFRLGYSLRGTQQFLPVSMCPIAAPLLWRAAEAVLGTARESRDLQRVLQIVGEVELFCDGPERKLQITFLCDRKQKVEASSFAKAARALHARCPELTGTGVTRIDPRSGQALEVLTDWGSPGLAYDVGDETYWITRGGFFQVNRSLLPRLVTLVCGERSGTLAWDLFAGVGLFSRVLAHSFAAVTAVGANAIACADLRRALGSIGSQHRAVEATTLEFLRRAAVDRERPDLILLDPPRAGAGEEACALLAHLRTAEIVYLSCDPTTLARDLAVLTASGYTLAELHLIDLFPQTYHLETLVVLRRLVAD